MLNDPRIVQMDVVDLEIGMYITELDRPWVDTPFLVEGFYVESQDDIEQLHGLCKYVFVDTRRSRKSHKPRSGRIVAQQHELKSRQQQPAHKEGAKFAATFNTAGKSQDKLVVSNRKLRAYEDQCSFDQEMGNARRAYNNLLRRVTDCAVQIRAGNKDDFAWVHDAIEAIVLSIVRNPDAAVWYARLKDQKQYGPRHAVSSAIWAAAFARALGFPQQDLMRVATGGLLLDVGKLGLPEALLDKEGKLSGAEFQQIQSHVQLGMIMVSQSRVANHTVTEMIETHHERYSGQGYPKGLEGDQIPLFGRIAGIVDCYDAITSHRVYAPALAPSEAIKRLYAWRGTDFQTSLIEAFIQAIGLYPAGTLVELTDGRVGVVMSGYRQQKLRPTLLMLLDCEKQPLEDPRRLNLAEISTTDDGKPLNIVSSLAPGSYGLDHGSI